jgi:hypothetical protein
MKRFLIFLSLFGLLFLTNCGKKQVVHVFDDKGSDVGSLEIDGDAAVAERGGKKVGKVESGTILAPDGKPMGKVMIEGEKVLIADATGNAVGSLEAGTNCFGKTPTMVGKISETLPSDLAAGGCYLLLPAR